LALLVRLLMALNLSEFIYFLILLHKKKKNSAIKILKCLFFVRKVADWLKKKIYFKI
jgi:hypothetical protein